MFKLFVNLILGWNIVIGTHAYADNKINLDVQTLQYNSTATSRCKGILQNCSITISQNFPACLANPGFISITNNSGFSAYGITASSTDMNYNSFVTQQSNCPNPLPANTSCTIQFFTNSPNAFTVQNIKVQGSNTNATYFDIQAVLCGAVATTIFSTTTFIIIPNAPGSTASMHIDNTGTDPAFNVAGVFNTPFPGVTIDSSQCPTLLAAGAGCDITFVNQNGLPGDNHFASLSGTNTNTLTVNVFVQS